MDQTAFVDKAEEGRFAEAIALANIPTLLMVLVQLTGETHWLEPPFRPIRQMGVGDNDTGGLESHDEAEVRDAALEAILAWKAGRPVALASPSEEMLVKMLGAAMGEPIPDEYGAFAAAQLGQLKFLEHEPIVVPEEFRVLVIGAGASGLCAAINLQQAGVPFDIVERNAEVGGVWLENRYPGAGVDTPNHLYSYSFADHDWKQYFCLRDELHGYLQDVSHRFDVRRHIRFETSVNRITYDTASQTWLAEIQPTGGAAEMLRYSVVISAAGLFNPPIEPDIPGLASWTGEKWHTARWPAGASVAGKRVAIIGNGASCMQTAPEIQNDVESLTIYQRSKHWAAPFEQFRKDVPDPLRFLFEACPLYRAWYRVRLAWTFNDRLHDALHKDPDWAHPDRALNAQNDAHRAYFTSYVVSELGDRADELLPKVLPTYPPFGKRMLMDNGWYRMMRNPKVTLVDERIDHIEGDSIVLADGTSRPADVLVLATGFDVLRMISTYDVVGRSGQTLRETWDDDNAQAYLGTTVPDFPNYFILYGPNLQAGHGGSLIFMVEMQVRYVMDAIAKMVAGGIGALEVRADVCERYNDDVQALHDQMVWTHPGMSTYYRNARGRIVINSPYRNVDFFAMTRTVDLDEYLVEPRHLLESVGD